MHKNIFFLLLLSYGINAESLKKFFKVRGKVNVRITSATIQLDENSQLCLQELQEAMVTIVKAQLEQLPPEERVSYLLQLNSFTLIVYLDSLESDELTIFITSLTNQQKHQLLHKCNHRFIELQRKLFNLLNQQTNEYKAEWFQVAYAAIKLLMFR